VFRGFFHPCLRPNNPLCLLASLGFLGCAEGGEAKGTGGDDDDDDQDEDEDEVVELGAGHPTIARSWFDAVVTIVRDA